MKIGFDISQTGDAKAGCGFFAENLIRHLATVGHAHEFVLYQTFGDHYWDKHYQKTFKIQTPNCCYGLHHRSDAAAKQFWRSPPANYEAALGNVDLLHSNNFFCPPKMTQGKLIYTLYDLSFAEYPDCTTEHNRLACFDGVFKASVTADGIVAISEFTREHFLRLFPHYPKERIRVIYPASRYTEADPHLLPSKKLQHLLPQQFWLTVGTLEPRKNIRLLLKAYAKLTQQEKTFPLVLAGKQGWMIDDLMNTLDHLGIRDQVHVLGYVDNQELQWLYQHCFYLVYPSLFEGFGLPVLEAMTLGAPVITSRSSSLPEVVGQAGWLIDPTNEQALLDILLKAYHEPQQRDALQQQARQQAKIFSWERAAQEMLAHYQFVLSQPEYKAQ